ncbi:MAG: hypothetical protein J6A19_08170 [Oscillospiraceae bacterium]|nr:hypothetical protein [Oscillospiraceae bacterium]
MSNRQVQISEDLFLDLLSFFNSDEPSPADAALIQAALEEKFDKLISRKLFTDYKRAPTPEEREAARQAYLDHVQISKSFRSPVEISL